MIVSGGDDQQISLILTDLNDHKKFKFYAHSSSIKGVTLSATANPLKYQIASSSYDQRFKRWLIDVSTMKIENIEVKRHCMSDINSIGKTQIYGVSGEVLDTKVALVGQGLSLF